MLKNLTREKLLRGEKILGTFFEMGSAEAVECLAISGLDYIIIDNEHGPFGTESTQNFVRAADVRGLTPFVRVKDITRPSILKALDIGAHGLLIPNVKTVEEVKLIVEYGKYLPDGDRGASFMRASGYGGDYSLLEYFETANRETLLIPQCETKESLECIEEIVAVPGIAGIFIGSLDLSISLKKPGQALTDPELIDAHMRVLKACQDAGKFCLVVAGNADGAKHYFDKGFHGVAVGMDISLYISAFKELVRAAKA